MPWYTTSMPASRAATAICSAPLEWPSSPGLPTSSRTGPPSSAAAACTRSRTSSISGPGAAPTAPTPVGARYSPNTSRSAAAHSPTVPPARGELDRRRHQVLVGRRDARAAGPSARSTAPASRSARHCSSASICSCSAAGSSTRMLASPSSDAGERRRLGLGEAVHADDRDVARLDARARARRGSARAAP